MSKKTFHTAALEIHYLSIYIIYFVIRLIRLVSYRRKIRPTGTVGGDCVRQPIRGLRPTHTEYSTPEKKT